MLLERLRFFPAEGSGFKHSFMGTVPVVVELVDPPRLFDVGSNVLRYDCLCKVHWSRVIISLWQMNPLSFGLVIWSDLFQWLEPVYIQSGQHPAKSYALRGEGDMESHRGERRLLPRSCHVVSQCHQLLTTQCWPKSEGRRKATKVSTVLRTAPTWGWVRTQQRLPPQCEQQLGVHMASLVHLRGWLHPAGHESQPLPQDAHRAWEVQPSGIWISCVSMQSLALWVGRWWEHQAISFQSNGVDSHGSGSSQRGSRQQRRILKQKTGNPMTSKA